LVTQNTAKKLFMNSRMLRVYKAIGGIEIRRCHRFYEFKAAKPWCKFMEMVADMRRQADQDPSKNCLANSWKLLSNSCYGKLIQRYLNY
jgi:hypothetical protein